MNIPKHSLNIINEIKWIFVYVPNVGFIVRTNQNSKVSAISEDLPIHFEHSYIQRSRTYLPKLTIIKFNINIRI